jgi:hypothetical protein
MPQHEHYESRSLDDSRRVQQVRRLSLPEADTVARCLVWHGLFATVRSGTAVREYSRDPTAPVTSHERHDE